MFHYIKSGRSFGPVSARDFLELRERHVLGPEDLVRVDGEGRWQPAHEIEAAVRAGRLSVLPLAVGKTPSSSMPPGSHTVFTSAPPIPMARVPKEAALAQHCPRCGHRARVDASFCKQCGTRLCPHRCDKCQRDNDADARFCEHCGHKLAAAVPV